jgi:hypothetical protein
MTHPFESWPIGVSEYTTELGITYQCTRDESRVTTKRITPPLFFKVEKTFCFTLVTQTSGRVGFYGTEYEYGRNKITLAKGMVLTESQFRECPDKFQKNMSKISEQEYNVSNFDVDIIVSLVEKKHERNCYIVHFYCSTPIAFPKRVYCNKTKDWTLYSLEGENEIVFPMYKGYEPINFEKILEKLNTGIVKINSKSLGILNID